MQRVWKRTYCVLSEFRRLRHGRQQQEFLEKDWKITLEASDIMNQKDLALEEMDSATKEENAKLLNENTELKKKEQELTKKVTSLSDQIRKAKADGYQPTRGRSISCPVNAQHVTAET